MDENERVTLNFLTGRLGVSSVECWTQVQVAEGKEWQCEEYVDEVTQEGFFKTFGLDGNRLCRSGRNQGVQTGDLFVFLAFGRWKHI